jgi:hypothetical protein
MKPLYLLLLAILPAVVSAQSTAAVRSGALDSAEAYWSEWWQDLHSMGVEAKNDSLIVRQEVLRLFNDTAYRRLAYPDTYNWPLAVALMRNMELKMAFWHLINLYHTDTANRSYVLGTFVAYDSLMNMDKILLSTFYTFAFADPRVATVKNNKPHIFRPDLLEQGLVRLKEIIAQVWYYRDERNKRLGKK